VAVLGALALMASCGLNPQPIPPGETDGADRDASTPTNAATPGDAGGAGKGDDGGFNSDDAGDASDSGDEDAADSGDT